jgi:hypothetical protein
MSFSRGEVVLLPIPFTDLTSRKVRPAVVIGHRNLLFCRAVHCEANPEVSFHKAMLLIAFSYQFGKAL